MHTLSDDFEVIYHTTYSRKLVKTMTMSLFSSGTVRRRSKLRPTSFLLNKTQWKTTQATSTCARSDTI
eukprot:1633066-Prymnesium_polylepis.1